MTIDIKFAAPPKFIFLIELSPDIVKQPLLEQKCKMGGGPQPCYPSAGWVFSLGFFYGRDYIITESDGAAGKAAGLCNKKKKKNYDC